jgi:hypothetical protein
MVQTFQRLAAELRCAEALEQHLAEAAASEVQQAALAGALGMDAVVCGPLADKVRAWELRSP